MTFYIAAALHPVDWIILIGFLSVIILVGLSYTKKASKSLTSFFLGGRNLPWWVAGISMVATTFAADTPLAVAGFIAKGGISQNWIWWNMLIGGMLTVFFFARLWRRSGVITEVQFLELRYGGRPARFLRGFKAIYLGLFLNVVIIGWVNVAMVTILKILFQISYTEAVMITAAAMVFTAIYASFSGLLGVAVTDVIQFVIAITGCIILSILVLNSAEIGGIAGLKDQLSQSDKLEALDFFPRISGVSIGETAKVLTISITTFIGFLGVQWWAAWYPGNEPGGGGYVAQRMMSTRTEKDSILATLLFNIAHYALRPWPWIIVGLCALVLYPGLDKPEEGFVLAMNDYLPVGLKGLLLVAFFAAYMSTISTQLNWGASYLVNDLYKRFILIKKEYDTDESEEEILSEEDNRKLVMAGRIATFLLMIVGIGVSLIVDSVGQAWEFLINCGAGLGLVLILRWYWWRINAWSEITATVAPFIGFGFIFMLRNLGYGVFEDFGISLLCTAAFTTFCWLTVTLLTKPEETAVLHRFYRKVRPGGWWKPIENETGYLSTGISFKGLFIGWLGAVIMTYGALFSIGKIILQEWMAGGLYSLAVVAGLLLVFLSFRLNPFIHKSLQ